MYNFLNMQKAIMLAALLNTLHTTRKESLYTSFQQLNLKLHRHTASQKCAYLTLVAKKGLFGLQSPHTGAMCTTAGL
jgi:hypothetical protein